MLHTIKPTQHRPIRADSRRAFGPHRRALPLAQERARSHAVRSMPQSAPAAAVEQSVATLKKAAASPGSVPPASLLAAVVQLEKARLPPAGWNKTLAAPRRRWHLVYTVPGKDVTAASKGKKSGSGMYFPLTGCQKFEDGQFENGVFLGPAASLTFRGPCAMKEGGRQMSFDVTTMHIGLGPWRWALPLKRDAPALEARPPKDVKKLPFFLYAYVDNDIVVARGRSGGLAMWRSVGAEWQATAGVLQVYK